MARMNIIFTAPADRIPQTAEQQNAKRLDHTSFGSQNLPLMWGKVLQYTGRQTVDVELANGLKLRNVPVCSSRWVKSGTTKSDDEATGRKDLPGIGAKVLLAFPDGVIDNSIILPISGFDILKNDQKATILKEDEQEIIVDVDEYGWKYTFDKSTGEITYESPDVDSGNKFLLTLDVEGKSIVVQHQYSTGATDKNVITIDENGISIVDKNGNEFASSSTGFSVTDKNGNTIVGSSTGLMLNDNLEVLQ